MYIYTHIQCCMYSIYNTFLNIQITFNLYCIIDKKNSIILAILNHISLFHRKIFRIN